MESCTTEQLSADHDTTFFIKEFFSATSNCYPPLLDLRCPRSFQQQHVCGATNFNGIDNQDGLLARLNELPAPSTNVKIAIVGSNQTVTNNAVEQLIHRGYKAYSVSLTALLEHLPTKKDSFSRALWSPAPIIRDVIAQIISNLELEERTAIDVGAGSGRDAAFLASHGFRVIAIDRDSKLLEKASNLGTLHATQGGSVNTIKRTFGAHLQDDKAFLQKHASSLLVVVRFLRRGVLELLHHAVLPNGFVVYEHFLRGCEKFGGPVKASQMLEMGELERVFSSLRGFSVIRSSSDQLQDGRPIVRFIAKRDKSINPVETSITGCNEIN